MKKTKTIMILDIIFHTCEFICMTMLVLAFNLSVLKYTDDITILRAVGLISASMVLPSMLRPFKNPGRLGLYTLGFLLATMATSFSKHPATELQAFSAIGFFTLMLWEFIARDLSKNIHLDKIVRFMDIILGTPWWEKEHAEKNTWGKNIVNFLRQYRLNKAVKKMKGPGNRYRQHQAPPESYGHGIPETRKGLQFWWKAQEATPLQPEKFGHGIPEVLHKTRQEFVGDDGRKYVIEHKLSVVDDDCT